MPLFALSVLIFTSMFLIAFFLLSNLDIKLFQRILDLRYNMPDFNNGTYRQWPLNKQAAYLSYHVKISENWQKSRERVVAMTPFGSLYLWCRAKLFKQPWPEPNPPFQWIEHPTLKVVKCE